MMLPADLAERIRDAPDDAVPYAVAADWLQQRGDVHGELIALSLAGREPERVKELERELLPASEHVWVRWKWGFVERIEVRTRSAPAIEAVVDAMLASAVGQFPRELSCTDASVPLMHDRLEQLACLRELAFHGDMASAAHDLGELPMLPRLVRLTLDLPHRPIRISSPTLERLWLRGGHEQALARSPLPALRVLELDTFHPDDPDELVARFPRLARLAVGLSDEWNDFTATHGLERYERYEPYDLGVVAQRHLVVDKLPRGHHPRLRYAGGGKLAPVSPFTSDVISIGRSGKANIGLFGDRVSRFHARFTEREDGWHVEMLGDTDDRLNNRWVNDAVLRHGDELRFADEPFVFEDVSPEPQVS